MRHIAKVRQWVGMGISENFSVGVFQNTKMGRGLVMRISHRQGQMTVGNPQAQEHTSPGSFQQLVFIS